MKDDRDARGQVVEMVAELVLKILLVGAPKSGKTSLVRRLCDKPFLEEYVPTLGFDFIAVPFGTYQGRPVMLHLWDVAGSQLNAEPCHHALVGDGVDGVLYVMDVTSRESLQAVDDWDRALSRFLPPWTCKLLLGHKADLPVYVVNGEALSMYVKGAHGFKGWCLTVGSSEYGDYDVAARRGGGGATADVGGRYKGQSLSGEKQLSVSEAMRTLIGHVFRARGSGGAGNRPAGVLGIGAGAGGATPFPPSSLDAALETVSLLGLGGRLIPLTHRHDQGVSGTRDSGDGGVGGRGRCEGMRELLKRGRGPGSIWWAGVGEGLGGGDRSALKSTASADPGWRHFAGRMGREEAEALLRGRPEGTFFLRRKGPSVLVLSYVAKSSGTPSSGRKSLGGTSPRRELSSPRGEKGAEGVSVRGASLGGRRDGGGSGEGGRGHTPVQHALLVHGGGFFSDEKGRLGRFPTIEELLKSKISALARYPLSFRREGGRYVLVDPAERDANPQKSDSVPPQQAQLPPMSEKSPATNPFALTVDTSATALIRGAAVSSLTPVVTGDLFGERQQDTATASVAPPPSTPLFSTPGSSPRVNTDVSRKDGRAERPHDGDRGGRNAGAGGEWVDKRSTKPRTKKSGGGGAGESSSSSGGSLWMEAAAAVQKSAVRGGGLGSGRRGSRAPTGGNGPGLVYGVAGKTSPNSSGDGSANAERRRYFRKGSTSSTDDGGSVSSSAAAELSQADVIQDHSELGLQQQRRYQHQRQQQQQPRSGELSTMAGAAEAAATMSVARNNPDAKRVEERVASVEALVNRAVTALERQFRPVGIVRQQSPREQQQQQQQGQLAPQSPQRQQSSPRFRQSSPVIEQAQHDRARSSSAYSSPRASASPTSRNVAEESRHQRWSVAAQEGTGAAGLAPLAGAAVLLMERACVSQRELLGSMQNVRERAVALAVAQTNVSSAGGDVPISQGSQSLPPITMRPFFPGMQFSPSVLPQQQRAGGNIDGVSRQAVTVSVEQAQPAGGVGSSGARATTGLQEALRTGGGSETTIGGGLIGLSCCRDFERVLGNGTTMVGSAAFASPDSSEGFPVGKDTLPATDGLGRVSPDSDPVSDVSVLAVSSSPRLERISAPLVAHSGGYTGVGVARERLQSSSSPVLGSTETVDTASKNSWSSIFRDVAVVEERCRGYVAIWETAGGAFRDAWEDDVLLGGGGDAQGLVECSAVQ